MKEYERPVVSISCAAYNHENYIADALEGFLAQKTNFPIEILIHDDASTDGTADIIRAYHAKYPDLIKPIFQVENQYSKGAKINVDFNFTRAKGRYIAICEGDDYWTDPLKLSKQVEAMERFGQCDISFHPVAVKCENSSQERRFIGCHSKREMVYAIEEVILGGGGFMPTASIMLRDRAIPGIIRFFEWAGWVPVGDVFMQILGAEYGGGLYLPMVSGVYRKNVSGGWSHSVKSNQNKADSWALSVLDSISLMDKYTNYRYSKGFAKKYDMEVFNMLKKGYVSIDVKRKIYKKYFRHMHIGKRLLWHFFLKKWWRFHY